jgi:hypothetical protein
MVTNYSAVVNYSVVEQFGRALMLADKQEDRFPAHHRGSRQGAQCEGLRRRRELERHPAHHEERKGPPLEPRWQDDQAPRLRQLPDLPLAGKEGVQPRRTIDCT